MASSVNSAKSRCSENTKETILSQVGRLKPTWISGHVSRRRVTFPKTNWQTRCSASSQKSGLLPRFLKSTKMNWRIVRKRELPIQDIHLDEFEVVSVAALKECRSRNSYCGICSMRTSFFRPMDCAQYRVLTARAVRLPRW